MDETRELRIYFDYLSPYAFFGWLQAETFCRERGLALIPEPVVFAGLLNHHGQLGPAEIPAKRLHAAKDTLRYALKHNIPFRGPKTHPFKSLGALRVSLPEVCGEHQNAVVDLLFKAAWSYGAELSDPQELESLLNKAGFPGGEWMQRAGQQEIKDLLKTRTEEAIERGVFGVPAMAVGRELFWGKDQFPYIADYLDGKEHPVVGRLDEMLGSLGGVRRRRPGESPGPLNV